MEAILILVLLFFAIIYSSWSWGFVAHKFYGWFVLTAIPSLPHFSTTEFIGFCLFISCITNKSQSSIKEEYEDKTKVWSYIILSPWVVLLCGWIVNGILF